MLVTMQHVPSASGMDGERGRDDSRVVGETLIKQRQWEYVFRLGIEYVLLLLVMMKDITIWMCYIRNKILQYETLSYNTTNCCSFATPTSLFKKQTKVFLLAGFKVFLKFSVKTESILTSQWKNLEICENKSLRLLFKKRCLILWLFIWWPFWS